MAISEKRAGEIFSNIGQKISNTFSDMGKNMKKAAGKVGETLDDLKINLIIGRPN